MSYQLTKLSYKIPNNLFILPKRNETKQVEKTLFSLLILFLRADVTKNYKIRVSQDSVSSRPEVEGFEAFDTGETISSSILYPILSISLHFRR